MTSTTTDRTAPVAPALSGAFHRLVTASAASNLGDGLLLVGAPLLVVQLTRDPNAVAGIQVALTLPWLLFALHAGALADRRGRRSLLVGAASLRATVLAAVGGVALLGAVPLPLLYTTLFVVGTSEVVFDTTSQSVVPELVDREQLGRANGRLIAVQTVMNNIVGAPLAGLLVALAAASVLLGPAALYGLTALLLVRLTDAYVPAARPPARMRHDIAEGLRYLRAHRTLRSIGGLACLLNLGSTMYFSVIVLFVVGEGSPMGLSEVAFGGLAALLALGGIGGSLLAPRLERRLGPRRAMLGSMLGLSTLMLLPVLTARVVPVAVMVVGLGALGIVVNVVAVSSRQRIVPSELLGRVNAAFRLLAVGAMPLGALLGGLVTSAGGLRTTFLVAVLIQLLALAVFHRPISDDVLLGDPDTAID
jgi:MFS family permease